MSGKPSDWGRIKKRLAVTNGKVSCSDRGSSGLDTGCVFQQQKLAQCQCELIALQHRSWHGCLGRAQPWLQRDSHLDLPVLQLLCNLKSFNFPPPPDCSVSPLRHTRKCFAFSSAEYKADISTRKGEILTNPETNRVCALACTCCATISNNLPEHSGAQRKVTTVLLPVAVQRGKWAQAQREVFTNTY